MRRVAYLTPLYFDDSSYLGGGERYPVNLAKALVARGDYEVEIVSYGEGPLTRRIPIAEGVNLRILPSAARKGPDRLSWEIISAVQETDIVHVHQIFTRSSEVGFLVAKLIGRPLCATDHGGASSWLGRSLGMLDLADRIVVYSRFAQSVISHHTSTQVEIVRGGVDDRFFVPPEVGADRDRLLYVGRLLPHKGIDRLLAALPADVPLSICGRPYDARYTALLQALARGKEVEFVTDATDERIRELYQRSFGVVLPSVYVDCFGTVHPWPELMGFSLLEGMACGAPAICSRVGGMPEYVSHDETGFIFDELADLTEYIDRCASDTSLVSRLGQAGRAEVERSYGLAAAGVATASLYDQLFSE